MGVAVVCMMFTPKCQRLGDLAAKTCVVRTKNMIQLVKVPEIKHDYTVTFLSDHDVTLIVQIISNPAILHNSTGLKKLADKVKVITQTSSDANNLAYLKKNLEDYNYMSGKLG